MTTTYDFDLARPRSRGARIARIDALATLLDTALVIPGTGVRFGLDALIGFFPVVGDTITPSHEVVGLERKRAAGVLTLRVTLTNQRGETILDGQHRYLIAYSPAP